jgi:DNA polymerase-3 subunit delta'
MKFDAFLGNPKIIARLQAKLREGRLAHGLIFSGPEGVGKRTCALMIAKALNCERVHQTTDAVRDHSLLFCDDCRSCRKIDAGAHPDVMTVGVEEDASQIRIAQIRQILSMLRLQPLEGFNKVFIIDPADLVNTEAANALLKGLEEPPENSFFILITVNVHELLLTVRSRCQTYHFAPLTAGQIRSNGVQDELLARWSQGSIGRARRLDIQELKSDREALLSFLETAVTAEAAEFREMLAASAEVSRSKQEFPNRLAILTVLVADLLYIAEGVPERAVNTDIQDRLSRIAARAGVERLIAMGEFLKFIENSMKNFVNRQMLTEMLALTANETMSKILNDNPRESR